MLHLIFQFIHTRLIDLLQAWKAESLVAFRLSTDRIFISVSMVSTYLVNAVRYLLCRIKNGMRSKGLTVPSLRTVICVQILQTKLQFFQNKALEFGFLCVCACVRACVRGGRLYGYWSFS